MWSSKFDSNAKLIAASSRIKRVASIRTCRLPFSRPSGNHNGQLLVPRQNYPVAQEIVIAVKLTNQNRGLLMKINGALYRTRPLFFWWHSAISKMKMSGIRLRLEMSKTAFSQLTKHVNNIHIVFDERIFFRVPLWTLKRIPLPKVVDINRRLSDFVQMLSSLLQKGPKRVLLTSPASHSERGRTFGDGLHEAR